MQNVTSHLENMVLTDNKCRQGEDMISALAPELVLEMIDDLSAVEIVSLKRANKALNAIINQHEGYVVNRIVQRELYRLNEEVAGGPFDGMSLENTFGLSDLPLRIVEMIFDPPYEVDGRYPMLMTSTAEAPRIIQYSLEVDGLAGLAWAALLEDVEVWWL